MKADLIAKGASRYVVDKVERFDQKNDMWKRPLWDSSVMHFGQKFYMEELMPKDEPGYMLKDRAIRDAAWYLELEFAQGVRVGRTGLYAWESKLWGETRLPKGIKMKVDDRARVTKEIKKVATFFGASLVRVCELDRRWLYSYSYDLVTKEHAPIEIPEDFKYAVALAIEMNYNVIGTSPTVLSDAATGLGYSKEAFVGGLLAQYIRLLGFKAIPMGNDTACSIPVAIDAGLGELARNGLLITPEFGPRVRIGKVFTDLPLVPDKPIEFGVWDFCLKCGKCAQHCPSRAIIHGEPTKEIHNISNREGLLRWPVNAEKCFGFVAANGSGCSNCIRVCPFNKPPGWLHDTVRWGVKHTRWLDSFFVRMDDLFGYGKPVSADHFWD